MSTVPAVSETGSISETAVLAPRDQRARDGGAVTVEAAIGICSVVAVFVLGLAGMSLVLGQLRCTEAAGEAARLLIRGDSARAADAVTRLAPGAQLSVTVRADVVVAEVRSGSAAVWLPVRWISGRAEAVLEPGVSVREVTP